MDNLEKINNLLRPIVANLTESQIEDFLIEYFKNINLKGNAILNNNSNVQDVQYWSNEEFWKKIITNYSTSLNCVQLKRFQIVDWFPRTPGIYHTEKAKYARVEAQKYVKIENGIKFYDPRGKMNMIDGGIGSVRFKTINISNTDYWLCTATSDGQCHSGVPLAIPNHLMSSIDFYSDYQITGKIKFLPKFLESHFYHATKVPQIYLVVEEIKNYGYKNSYLPLISPMVFFTSTKNNFANYEGNVTFVFCQANSNASLDLATEWLSIYVDKYGDEIITNFDEQRPTFKDAPFSLQKILNGNFNTKKLSSLSIRNVNVITNEIEKIYNMEVSMSSNVSKNEITNSTINGNVIAAQDSINSFNKNDDANKLIKELKKLIENTQEIKIEDKENIVDDLEIIEEQLDSEKPKITRLKKALNNIRTFSKMLPESLAIGSNIFTKLQELIDKSKVFFGG